MPPKVNEKVNELLSQMRDLEESNVELKAQGGQLAETTRNLKNLIEGVEHQVANLHPRISNLQQAQTNQNAINEDLYAELTHVKGNFDSQVKGAACADRQRRQALHRLHSQRRGE